MMDSIEQIEAMRAGVDYRFPIRIRQFQLEVRPLSIMESVQVAQQVAEEVKKVPDSARNRLTEHTFLAKATLIKATTSDVGANDPKITDYIMDRMTGDEVQALFKQYISVVDRANPSLEFMENKDVEVLIDSIKKNRTEMDLVESDSQLTELSIWELASIVRYFLTKDD